MIKTSSILYLQPTSSILKTSTFLLFIAILAILAIFPLLFIRLLPITLRKLATISISS